MAVSAADSLSQIPGFRDRLGERVVAPQPSGALLEFLYFCEPLASAPFFENALKQRVSRLSNFRHSSYCRVRRVQAVAERKGQPALVSAHVAGRRLSEILEIAARGGLHPTTAAALAVTKQLMAAVALLHDCGPDVFHGVLGPERLILAGDGRIVVAEHVLGGVVEQAAASWSRDRLWREFQVAVLADPAMPQFCRRCDVLQIGMVTLAMLVGRPIGPAEYPSELPRLIDAAREHGADGEAQPLRRGLRTWLERSLQIEPDAGYRTLLESQKSLANLLHDGGYGASSAAWEAFVNACEAAASKLPISIVPSPAAASETAPGPEVAARPAAAAPAGDSADAVPAFVVPASPAPASQPDGVAGYREDPFGPWPVAVPAGSAAALFDQLQPGASRPGPMDELGAAPAAAAGDTGPAATSSADETAADSWAPKPDPNVSPEYRPETLFESPRPAPPPVPEAPPPQPQPFAQLWEEPPSVPAPAATSVADWNTADTKSNHPYPRTAARERVEREAAFEDEYAEEEEAPAPKRSPARLAVLGTLAVLGLALFIYSPYLWARFYDGPRTVGVLVVESDPQGATVLVDGEPRGEAPLELSLRTGEHQLELQSGGSAKSKTIVIQRNERLNEKMTFPEAGERGGVRIATYPTTARVTLDGTPRGETPLRVTDLEPGPHTVILETSLGTQVQEVIVEAGKVGQVAVPTAAWIKVNAPYDLKVLMDGRVLGTTGSSPVLVPPGGHHFEFVNQALSLKLRQYANAPAGELTVVPLDLPLGMLNIYADQAAEVWLDGQRVGETPLVSYAAPLGSHEVVYRHKKYGEVRYTVMVTLAAPVELKVTFRK